MTTTTLKTWTFAGVAFGRLLQGDTDPRWFVPALITAIDPVLYGTTRYVDIGGMDTGPLSLRVMVDQAADRDALLAAVGTSDTLTAASGQSGTALLIKASPSAADGSGFWFLDLEFQVL